MLILGFESSCDETAVAIVRDGREILANKISSQIEIHALYGGVVPEIASRAHTEAISSLTNEALEEAGLSLSDIDAIAVTNCPGLIGALLVGVNFAKSLAYKLGIPLIPVHHIRGHIAANYCYFDGNDGRELLVPPFTSLVMSGGHTSLIGVNGYTDFEILGATRDDAAGEAFDKVARLLSLPYPGGAKMDKLAYEGDKNYITFPQAQVKDSPFDFSFSGLKTAAINYIHKLEQNKAEYNKADIAASYTDAVVKAITKRVELLFEDNEKFKTKKFVLAGGVSANSHIRRAIAELADKYGVKLYVPPLSLCGDNAVMIASQGYYEYTVGNKTAGTNLNAYATMGIDEV
ncbi:MAG: tRNA (adenosine(37)-N6)-threonylcarbamoyltransferase complex transferase subunit TsaD [Ruminococcaceae bacterium]|nr:tRNA (adenosine(37)-N6)-threonylcarbamoyltransferase complex transferase subunit TsaD [Oscillospiraceae bacterium]